MSTRKRKKTRSDRNTDVRKQLFVENEDKPKKIDKVMNILNQLKDENKVLKKQIKDFKREQKQWRGHILHEIASLDTRVKSQKETMDEVEHNLDSLFRATKELGYNWNKQLDEIISDM